MTGWPRITIVTPSYNQGAYLPSTIESVLGQNYPNLEYMVVDGGSTDGSTDIIRRFERRLTWSVSEPDRGQPDAIRKGFERATGDLLGWINSDDLLEPDALLQAGAACAANPGCLIAGDVLLFGEGISPRRLRQRNLTFTDMVQVWTGKSFYSQPGVFFPRSLYEQVGGIDSTLHYTMDHDLMNRLLQVAAVKHVDAVLARARRHPHAKTSAQSHCMIIEGSIVSRRYWHALRTPVPYRWTLAMMYHLLRCTAGRLYHGRPSAALAVLQYAVTRDWQPPYRGHTA